MLNLSFGGNNFEFSIHTNKKKNVVSDHTMISHLQFGCYQVYSFWEKKISSFSQTVSCGGGHLGFIIDTQNNGSVVSDQNNLNIFSQ